MGGAGRHEPHGCGILPEKAPGIHLSASRRPLINPTGDAESSNMNNGFLRLTIGVLSLAVAGAACTNSGNTTSDVPQAPVATATMDTVTPATTAAESAERFCANLIAGNVAGVVGSFTNEGYASATPLLNYFELFSHLTGEPHLEASDDGQPNHFRILAPTDAGIKAVETSWVQVNGRWLIDHVSVGPYKGAVSRN